MSELAMYIGGFFFEFHPPFPFNTLDPVCAREGVSAGLVHHRGVVRNALRGESLQLAHGARKSHRSPVTALRALRRNARILAVCQLSDERGTLRCGALVVLGLDGALADCVAGFLLAIIAPALRDDSVPVFLALRVLPVLVRIGLMKPA